MAIFRNKREGIIYVPGDVKTLGGLGTCRYPICLQDAPGSTGVRGFFSEEQTIPERMDRFHETMDIAKKQFPRFVAYISLLESSDYEAGYEYCRQMMDLTGQELRPIFPEIITKLGGTPHLAERLLGISSFYADHQTILNGYIMAHEKSKNYLDDLQLSPGEPILCRNIAMYKVAQLLGIGHLITVATPMTVSYHGEIMHGVFMETCPGYDLAHLQENHTLAIAWGKEAVKNARADIALDVIGEISDLQILDYLCCNIDRHGGNLMYTLEVKNNKGQLTHIRGIDNDASFGLSELRYEQIKHVSPLSDIRVMTDTMAQKLGNITGSDLTNVLKHTGISQVSIEAAVSRLALLQELLHGSDGQSVTIVPRNELEPYMTQLIGDDEHNIFYYALTESYLRVQDRLDGSDVYSPKDRIVYSPAYYI